MDSYKLLFISKPFWQFKNEPFIFAIGKIYSGDVRNITPGRAKIEGGIRGVSEEKVLEHLTKFESVLTKLKNDTGVDYKIKKGAHYPEVIVDKGLFRKLQPVLSKDFNFIDCGYKMTAEDFGFFSQKWPSFML